MNEEIKLTNFIVKVPIYKQNRTFIIRKGGANVKKTRDEANAKIDLPAEGAESDVIAIHGPNEDVMKAKKCLLEISNEKQLVGHTAEIKANPEQHNFLLKRGVEAAKNELNSLITQLKDVAKTTTEIDPKLHCYFVARGAKVLKQISNDYGSVTVSFPKITLMVVR
ncbi:vigilin [Nephila pilipes]|uniref:Vigilin n=1 Tax=Nephila pilipes TaxID=299642 RepID=A0A8X6JFY7_NEPPI|nr:vigilin [Nephila pilipes]